MEGNIFVRVVLFSCEHSTRAITMSGTHYTNSRLRESQRAFRGIVSYQPVEMSIRPPPIYNRVDALPAVALRLCLEIGTGAARRTFIMHDEK